MQVHQLKSPEGSRRHKKTVGRGRGTGHGKRCGRGQTGQNCRSGRGVLSAYEGGQMTLLRRLPKVGFNSKWPVRYQLVNCESLNLFENGATVTPELLKSRHLIKSLSGPVKILSAGDLKRKLTVQAHSFSKEAGDKITKAGGTLTVLS
ncbi:MAG: 50S ribosomal protein L15 [Candidatus Omnitrophica bacterium]|nr:50S ribosomal protein L15 [Candidatus Omnitrophota bacterium]MDE2008505.1 50S ribosomal protein L15 [Candidatus Omnitrophota bacterium]MDE2231374.1 50S ribosomal protein L15 [Candidatus Omnitrophota bacterium]